MNLEELDTKHRLATGARTFEEFCKVIELLFARANIRCCIRGHWDFREFEGTAAACIDYVVNSGKITNCVATQFVICVDGEPVIWEREATR